MSERDKSCFQGARQDRERDTGLHLSSYDLFLTLRLLIDCDFKGLERVNHGHSLWNRTETLTNLF